jgi:hypothetical protein
MRKVYLNIDRTLGGASVLIPGTYVNTLAGSTAGGYLILAAYNDAANESWSPTPFLLGNPDPFTITITSISTTRVVGTFSGTVRDASTGAATKAITEGVFNLPVN